MHYAGWTLGGNLFDSSYSRGESISFGLNQVISGWTEALQLMPVGSTYRIVLAPGLAYGDRGSPPVIGANATLVFEVDLVAMPEPNFLVRISEVEARTVASSVFEIPSLRAHRFYPR